MVQQNKFKTWNSKGDSFTEFWGLQKNNKDSINR